MKEYHPRFPKKSAEEIKVLDKVLAKLDLLISEDEREVLRNQKQQSQIKTEASGLSEQERLKQRISGDFYYQGAGDEALKKWRAMSEEEKAAQRKGDDIDEIDTTDLERDNYVEHEEGESLMDSGALDYIADNRINLARAFLGYDGGYSIRKLKKFFKQSLDGRINDEG